MSTKYKYILSYPDGHEVVEVEVSRQEAIDNTDFQTVRKAERVGREQDDYGTTITTEII